jgi:hypothetical protein
MPVARHALVGRQAARHERVCGKARIGEGVFDDEDLVGHDGVGPERQLAWRLPRIDTMVRLEPPALRIEQRDERARYAEDLAGQGRDPIERPFGLGIEDAVAIKRAEPLDFIHGDGKLAPMR